MPKPPSPDRRSGSALDLVRLGLAAHQAGRLDEAARHYRDALVREPRNGAANHLLGVILLGRRQPAEASEHIARAVVAEPRNAQYLANLGVALNAAGRPREALDALDRAIRSKPDFAEAHSNRGMVLRTLMRFEEAVSAQRQAVALKPDEAGFHFNLANALEDLGEFPDALQAYRKAATLKPGYARAHAGASRIARLLGRLGEARSEADAAVAANPAEPDATLALGLALRATDDLPSAVLAYDALLARQPENPDVLFDRAMTARYQRRDATVDAMARAFADAALAQDGRVRAGFALGKVLSDIGEDAESVAVFRRANGMVWSSIGFDVDRAIEPLRRIERAFADIPADLRSAGDSTASPIFVVGLPRSGKTTVERLLSRHSGIAPLAELNRFSQLVGRAMPEGIDRLDQLSRRTLEGIGSAYLSYTRELAGASARTIDTMPGNFDLVGHIVLALPGARIIVCRRDPLDHCVALFEKLFGKGGFGYTYDLRALATYYAAHRRLAAAWNRSLGASILVTDTARLRQGDATEARRVLEFCGLPADAADGSPIESEPQTGPGAPDPEVRRAAHLAFYQPELGRYLAENHVQPPVSLPAGDNR